MLIHVPNRINFLEYNGLTRRSQEAINKNQQKRNEKINKVNIFCGFLSYKYTKKIELFDDIITADDISKPKPDPEGFNLAIQRFNVDPKNAFIFEDAEVGIKAARKTGAVIFKVEKF